MSSTARSRRTWTFVHHLGQLTLGLLLLAQTVIAQSLPQRLGDLDADGQPSVYDLVRLINHINGTIPLPGSLIPYGDVNESGTINQNDVDLIADAILGLAPLPDPYAPPIIQTPVT